MDLFFYKSEHCSNITIASNMSARHVSRVECIPPVPLNKDLVPVNSAYCTLQIVSASVKDSGLYVCQVRGDTSISAVKETKVISLLVYGEFIQVT